MLVKDIREDIKGEELHRKVSYWTQLPKELIRINIGSWEIYPKSPELNNCDKTTNSSPSNSNYQVEYAIKTRKNTEPKNHSDDKEKITQTIKRS